MSQVLVWKSDADGKLFEDKTKYTKHLRVLANERAQTRRIAKMNADREAFIVRMGATVKSFDELKQFIHDNWDWFYANGLADALWKCDKKPKIKHKLVSISFDDMRWSDSVSNTHSCPRNGVTNWAQHRPENAHLPKGYPGWRGTIRFTVDAGMSAHKKNPYKLDGWGSSYFKSTIVNTGGGSSGTNAQYEVRLYAADFPAMALARERAQTWNVLADGNELEFA
jgi:hypothetical protein